MGTPAIDFYLKEIYSYIFLSVFCFSFVGDCQIPLACSMFLESNGKELLRRNLYRNFVLHLCNMFDFGLLSGLAVYTTLQKLQNLILLEGDSTSSEFSQVLISSCEAQRLYWIQEGSKRAPKLLEIRPPLSSPTGDGVRRKPAGNYSPVHSPSLGSGGSATPTTSSANEKPSKQSSAPPTSSSTNEKRDKTSGPQTGGSKRKLSIEDSKGAGASRKLSIEESKGAVASRKLSIEESKGASASRKVSVEESKGAVASRKVSVGLEFRRVSSDLTRRGKMATDPVR
uniref:Polycomb protein Su(Z)12 n=1 Tax=Cacopsylla melanoneura TaxID=428564 RepID=A0A8D9AQJ6_9HEMI